MAWGKVDLCGLDTSKLPVLTPQRMQELYPLVHSGDKAARDEFIQGICGWCCPSSSAFPDAAKTSMTSFKSGASG